MAQNTNTSTPPPLPFNVVNYLTARLKELGVTHMFAVPGDYTSDLLAIVDGETNPLTRIGTCNELNAGMAAYGYALGRTAAGNPGPSCVAITTGVGAASVLNGITAAWVEMSPVVLVIGTLSNQKLLTCINNGELFHHTIGAQDENRQIFQNITSDFEKITDPLLAPAQIDRALTACISTSRPVAIEIMEDCYYLPCAMPVGKLMPVPSYTDFNTLTQLATNYGPGPGAGKYASLIVGAVNAAVTATMALLNAGKRPVFWVGVEVGRYGLQEKVQQILEITQANWASTLLGKGVLAENTPNFIGVYDGCFEHPETLKIITESDCFIGLGSWSTDLNEFAPKPPKMPHIWATRNIVKDGSSPTLGIKNDIIVTLENYLDQLYVALTGASYQPTTPAKYNPAIPTFNPTDQVSYDSFWVTANKYLQSNHILVGDIGLYTFGCVSYMNVNVQGAFMCQSIWAHIGWSVPGSLGAGFGSGMRPIVVVGDGSFKLTCQEISTMVANGLPSVIFVLVNTVYGVEQILDDPAPYEPKSTTPFEAANILTSWNYQSLMAGFSNNSSKAMSLSVNTVADMENAWQEINALPDVTWLVAVNLNMRDYPHAWAPFVPNSPFKN